MNNKFTCDKNIRIRPSSPADKKALSELFHQTRNFIYEHLDASFDYKRFIVEQQESFREIGYGNQFPNAMEFVIEQQNDFIGRVTLDFSYDTIRIVDIALIEKARGKGFGEAALKGIQAAAASSGATLVINVAQDNTLAYRLYQKLGFVSCRRGDLYHTMIWQPSVVKMAAV